jgi:NAD(P)-dependent dehydrogenase (short-subunit alcohol dehydrogenase family)
MSHTHRVVLITGCSSGIGKATALRLAAAGSHRLRHRPQARRDRRARAPAATCSPSTSATPPPWWPPSSTIEAAHGAVSVLVNNAGYSQSGAVEAVPLDRVRAQFETNVFGLIRLTQLVLPGMRAQRWGRVINLSSMGGKLVFPGGGYYHATKYALEALSDAMRFEVRGFGISVVLIEPGLIKSGFSEAAVSAMSQRPEVGSAYDEFHAAVSRATVEAYEKGPLAKLAGVPDDVAQVIERAITAARPRARYRVTLSATMLLAQRRWSSDVVWDWFLRQSFPTPA